MKRIEFRDYNDPVIAGETPYDPMELARQMHVRRSDGRWVGGYFGWIEVLKLLPRWRWAALLAWLPPLRWLGPMLYRLLAANRYRIARLFMANERECRRCAVPTTE